LIVGDMRHVDTVPQAGGADSRPGPAAEAPASGPAHRLGIGERVGHAYEITALLGEGGMGTVYEARDLGLNRIVALKVPLPSGDPQILRREAQGLAAVRHPNLVTIHALGQHAGVDFIVMERIHGATLEERCDALARAGKRFGIAEVVDFLLAITDALSAIHHAGIAHRDLKLGNVMIAGSRVVVMDLGLVTAEFDVLVASKHLAGSIHSMSPELIRGDVQPGQGSLVDLYALGILAFQLLAGQAPFPSDDVQLVFLAHLAQPVPDVRALRPDTPLELAELIQDLMVKSPEDRPECAEVVLWRLTAIRATLASKPSLAPLSVLIVDDDAYGGKALRRSLIAALPRLAVEVTTRPETAIALIESHRPALVLVDLNMPEVNGIELCMEILALPPDVRPEIVTMSAEATHDDIQVLASLGVSRFVPKDARFVARMSEVIGEVRRSRA
jgi:serine/threonine-protein kinase